jgi:hypothetical protein
VVYIYITRPDPREATRLQLENKKEGLVAHLSATLCVHGDLELYRQTLYLKPSSPFSLGFRFPEEKESKVFAGDSNDTAVLTRSLDNSGAFPMTNQEKQDKSSAESLEMAEDDILESERV